MGKRNKNTHTYTIKNEIQSQLIIFQYYFQSLRTSLNPLLTLLWPQEDGAKTSNCFFSLVGLRSNSGFNAGLLLAHQSEQNRIRQMEQLAPHLGMLGTLMTLMVGKGREGHWTIWHFNIGIGTSLLQFSIILRSSGDLPNNPKYS